MAALKYAAAHMLQKSTSVISRALFPLADQEVAMNDMKLQHPNLGLAALRNILARWDERKRNRWELEQMSRANPHLIDDIGLTRHQFETEIAKPFWRA